MHIWLLSFVVAWSLSLAAGSACAADRLLLLKRVTLDLTSAPARIDLREAKGAFRALRVKAAEGSITLNKVIVGYADRQVHVEDRKIILYPRERTREINPTPAGHFVVGVELQFVPSPGRKAVIEIYGRQADTDANLGRPKLAAPPALSRGVQPDGREAGAGQPRSAPVAASTEPLACVVANTCTPVQLFFGTNREHEERADRVAFTWRDANRVTLGSAVVTVPRNVRRETGQIMLPTWWDRYVLRVPPEGDPARHFVIVPNRFEIYANADDFLAAVSRHMAQAGDFKDHAFVYIHGYRVGFDYALYRTAQIAYDLGTPRPGDGVIVPFGTAFLYSWPSAGELKDYTYDTGRSNAAIGHLKEFLELIVQKSGVKHVHLIAHSMGNVPLLGALQQMAGQSVGGAKVSQIVLASPDVRAQDFKILAESIKSVADGLTLYASSSDLAMEASRRVNKNEPRAGDVIGGKPVVVPGVDSIDISAITSCYFCFGHDEYVEQPVLLNDIGRLLTAGIRPPDARTKSFHLKTEADGAFWQYTP